VGIFLLLLILFQTYLWRRSIASSHPETDAERYEPVAFVCTSGSASMKTSSC
jgi:hypothetical protein